MVELEHGDDDSLRVRFMMPERGEIPFLLEPDENQMVTEAIDHLDTDMGLFINMACKWGNANDPNLDDRIGHKHGEKLNGKDDPRYEIVKKQARSELIKTRVLDFAEFVTTEEPDSEWVAGNGELEMFGDLSG